MQKLESNGAAENRPRLLHLDILRLIAFMLVVNNHTHNDPIYELGSLHYVGQYYLFLCYLNTPLFAMISGALLLKKEEPYPKIWLRFVKIATTLVVISIVYFVLFYEGTYTFRAGLSFFAAMWAHPSPTALWYLYMYAGFIVMLPLLRKMINAMGTAEFKYYLAILVLLGTIPYIAAYIGLQPLSTFFQLPLFTMYTTAGSTIFLSFFILGYYMEHVFDPSRYKPKGLLVSIPVFLLAQAVYLLRDLAISLGLTEIQPPITSLSLPNLISLVCLWYTVATLVRCVPPGKTAAKIIVLLSGATFGAYLIHVILIEKSYGLYGSVFAVLPHPLLALMSTQLMYALASLGISLLLGLIPGVRWLIGAPKRRVKRRLFGKPGDGAA